MNESPEQFDELRRLLKLKRHEAPPPGYFDRFPGQVQARLEELQRSTRWDLLSPEAPWLRKLLAFWEAKPAFTGSLGALVGGLLVYGMVSTQSGDMTASVDPQQPEFLASGGNPLMALSDQSSGNIFTSGTNAILNFGSRASSPFERGFSSLSAQPVVLNISGGN